MKNFSEEFCNIYAGKSELDEWDLVLLIARTYEDPDRFVSPKRIRILAKDELEAIRRK